MQSTTLNLGRGPSALGELCVVRTRQRNGSLETKVQQMRDDGSVLSQEACGTAGSLIIAIKSD